MVPRNLCDVGDVCTDTYLSRLALLLPQAFSQAAALKALLDQTAAEPLAAGGDSTGIKSGGASFLRGLFVSWSVRYQAKYHSLQEVRASVAQCR